MNVTSLLEDVEKENIIWLIYLFLIGANFISNYYTEKYLYTMDHKYQKIFRNINILILAVILIIYIYFVYLSNKALQKDNKNIYKIAIYIASILIFIGGLIYLIVEIKKNTNPEISII